MVSEQNIQLYGSPNAKRNRRYLLVLFLSFLSLGFIFLIITSINDAQLVKCRVGYDTYYHTFQKNSLNTTYNLDSNHNYWLYFDLRPFEYENYAHAHIIITGSEGILTDFNLTKSVPYPLIFYNVHKSLTFTLDRNYSINITIQDINGENLYIELFEDYDPIARNIKESYDILYLIWEIVMFIGFTGMFIFVSIRPNLFKTPKELNNEAHQAGFSDHETYQRFLRSHCENKTQFDDYNTQIQFIQKFLTEQYVDLQHEADTAQEQMKFENTFCIRYSIIEKLLDFALFIEYQEYPEKDEQIEEKFTDLMATWEINIESIDPMNIEKWRNICDKIKCTNQHISEKEFQEGITFFNKVESILMDRLKKFLEDPFK